ncbi:MAG TPA: hypothetical protein VIJ94_15320 [Caulobacteraceae bacterium]
MTASPFIVWLGWACYAGAAFAIVVYLAHLLGSQPHKRPWGAAGLLFTSLALGQTPFLFEDAYSGGQITRAVIVAACLLAALAFQAYALLRLRAGEAAGLPAPAQGAPEFEPQPAPPPAEGSDA